MKLKSHLAITGKSWSVIQEHYPEIVARCVVRGTIFARMSPDQKQQLIQELQKLGYVVGGLCLIIKLHSIYGLVLLLFVLF